MSDEQPATPKIPPAHPGLHAALDALLWQIACSGGRSVEGQATIRPAAELAELGAPAIQLTIKILGPDDPPTDYPEGLARNMPTMVYDPATNELRPRRENET
jgi:hypothetical protein